MNANIVHEASIDIRGVGMTICVDNAVFCEGVEEAVRVLMCL